MSTSSITCIWLIALLSGASVIGCDDSSGSPSSLIVAPRVLALQADPPVASLSGGATVTALVVGGSAQLEDITGSGWELSFRACSPWQVVSDPGVDCRVGDALALPSTGMSAELVVGDVLAAFPPPEWVSLGPGDGVSQPDADDRCGYSYVEVAVVVEARQPEQGIALVAVKRLRVTLEDVERTNPEIAAMELDGGSDATSFRPGAEHTLSVVPTNLDPGCDDSGAFEALRVFLYTDGGELDEPYLEFEYDMAGEAFSEPITWLAPATGPVTFWLVAIDDDGGVGWRRFQLQATTASARLHSTR